MTRSNGPHLPEVAETAAAGRVREIYADIRAVLGVPMVNLVYRSLAPDPALLDWAWSAVRPHFTSGALRHAAAGLPPSAGDGELLLPRPALRIVGLTAADEKAIANLLDAYNRVNPRNLIAFLHIARLLRDEVEVPPPADTGGEAGRESPIVNLPAMRPLEAMEEPTRELVLELSALTMAGRGASLPSLYRHLANWPGFLAIAATALQPLFAGGRIDAAVLDLQRRAETAASHLGRVGPGLGLDLTQRQLIDDVLRRFPSMIPKMAVVGGLLRRAMPDR